MFMSILSACMPIHLKRASNPIVDGCEICFCCWDLNSVPLEEMPVPLTTEPSHQNHPKVISNTFKKKEESAGTRNILVVMLRRGYKVSSIELGIGTWEVVSRKSRARNWG